MVMRSGGGQTGTGYKQLYWRLPVLCDHVFSEEQQLPRTQHLKLRVFLIRLCLLQTFQEAQGTCCHSSSCWTWPPPPIPVVDLKFRTAFRVTVKVRGPASKYRVLRGMEKSVSKNTSPLPFITRGCKASEKSTEYGLN